jgi:hypothetical protein
MVAMLSKALPYPRAVCSTLSSAIARKRRLRRNPLAGAGQPSSLLLYGGGVSEFDEAEVAKPQGIQCSSI